MANNSHRAQHHPQHSQSLYPSFVPTPPYSPYPPHPQPHHASTYPPPPLPHRPPPVTSSYPSPPPSAGPPPSHHAHAHSYSYGGNPTSPPPTPQSPPGGGYAVSPPPPQHQQQQQQPNATSGYKPVSFDGPSGTNVESFYGNLLDPLTHRPTEIFSRLTDSLFFYTDTQCDIPGLRNTRVIEPAKYAWMTMRCGASLDEARLIMEYIESLYESAGLPVQYRSPTPQTQTQYQSQDGGRAIAVLDQRAFLHSAVFEARADPEETWKFWQKALTLLTLTDPSTSLPFPIPIPRTAFPPAPDLTLATVYQQWQMRVAIDVQSKKTVRDVQRQIAAVVGVQRQQAYLPSSVPTYLPAQSQTFLAPQTYLPTQTQTYLPASAPPTDGGGEHANKLDAITSVATLLNTGLTIFGAGSGGVTGFGN
ncbi:hypothetical protein BDY19DRAFT_947667 [Irpex rosettiformis]|uniref:Uncharacterized protein n=1 Tax=Irpex rosettiformis TaxID=378272 RepID=A0ACB8U2F9_9APHY|nr:hypothetical protein BDY19DRAFT_947667 [Irpex rosettiformis]